MIDCKVKFNKFKAKMIYIINKRNINIIFCKYIIKY